MIIEQRIKDFENLGFGMFVHFGLYSVHGKGEWAYNINITPKDYEKLFYTFNPDKDWAKNLVSAAKGAGCKYITITTRHHDGFSLYDTCGLNEYDAPHSSAGRDLIREFVDECNMQGIVPFFYHTLLDWHEKSYKENFPEYLKYLRASVEILCKNYGKIGGLWFDGMWDKKEENWEEDELYSLIRKYQPDAMIINNTGLSARGELGHIELDSVTFERGRPHPINLEDSPKYIASEMCQIFGNYWGYAKRDFNFKSLKEIIEDFCVCRRYGANYLLNIGPMGNGQLRPLDKAMLGALGEWVDIYSEALYTPRPSKIEIEGKEKSFLLEGEGCYYLFAYDIGVSANINVELSKGNPDCKNSFKFDKQIKSVKWLDNGEDVLFSRDGDEVTVVTTPQLYGEHLVVKIAKIEI
ncbi:MAG: alpha-L-fucosidase [Clostridia bacterium]|nr:alpha-L-fucosidase [Clostridia bacterium]